MAETTRPKRAPAKRKSATTKKTTAKRKSTVAVAAVSNAPSAGQPTTKHLTKRTYLYAVGRRKSAIARVRLHQTGDGAIMINGQAMNAYFPVFALQQTVNDPLQLTKVAFGQITVKTHGGGKRGQAEAVRLGISRILEKMQPDLRTTLKRAGFLSRDPRVKERKKYGLKRARRAPQWQKR